MPVYGPVGGGGVGGGGVAGEGGFLFAGIFFARLFWPVFFGDKEIRMKFRAGCPNFHPDFRPVVLRLIAAQGIYTRISNLRIPAATYLG